MKCPVCQGQLAPKYFKETEVDICDAGCGAWFDREELSKVEQGATLAEIDAAFPGQYEKRCVKESMADAERHCPRDNAVLDRFEWNLGSGIVIDRCTRCDGTWLDAGEMEGFAFFVQNFRQQPPELTPELREKMNAVKRDMDARYDAMIEESTSKVFQKMRMLGGDESTSVIDDLLRGLTRLAVR